MSAPETWKYYNHAYISGLSPDEIPDLVPIQNRSIWAKPFGKGVFMCRWTENFDCPTETNWWYCIKDDVFDINSLPSKKRYEINKGKRNFEISHLDPLTRIDELWAVQQKSFLSYPAKYRPRTTKEEFEKDVASWSNYTVFCATQRITGEICAYALLKEHRQWISFPVLKANPEYEKLGVNAAIMAGICEYYNPLLSRGIFICDGERNILHETQFQSYLERYFGFRKAYCTLHLAYRPSLCHLIRVLQRCRKTIGALSFLPLFTKIQAVLQMDALAEHYDITRQESQR